MSTVLPQQRFGLPSLLFRSAARIKGALAERVEAGAFVGTVKMRVGDCEIVRLWDWMGTDAMGRHVHGDSKLQLQLQL